MALEFLTAESPCVIWRTKLPRLQNSCETQTFARGRSHLKFRLDCSCYSGNTEFFKLCLINCNQPKLILNVNLSVYVENDIGLRKNCYCGTIIRECSFLSLTMQDLKTYYGINGDEISFLFIFDVNRVRERTVGKEELTSMKSDTAGIQSPCLQAFSLDIQKLLGNTYYSDAVLKCGDKYYPVNRNILSARSEVFAAMFHNKLKESQTGEVDIPNVEPNVMEQFLLYIYSGRAEALSLTTAFSLYQISDMYKVLSLKSKCASILADNLSEDTVCQVLQLAQYYENKELLDIATSFVATKAEFMKSTTWKTFANDYPGIAVKVFMKLL